MNYHKNIKYLILTMIVTLAIFLTGSAYAQHEGGLGEKKIHLNIAGKDQLMKIEGMTEDLAKAILEYREKSGFFKNPEDLLKVPGITQDIYKKIDPKMGTEGDLYSVPRQGEELEEDDEDIPLSPSKC